MDVPFTVLLFCLVGVGQETVQYCLFLPVIAITANAAITLQAVLADNGHHSQSHLPALPCIPSPNKNFN